MHGLRGGPADARDGTIRRVLIRANEPVSGRQLVHSRWVIRDITELLEREQAARHRAVDAGRLKDEFLALLSHELRTPLGAILVWLGLLRQGESDPAETTRALEIIERSARTLERIIEDLLHASRIAAGGLMLSPQLVDLRGVVQVAVDAASGDAAIKGLSLDSSLGRGAGLGDGGPGPAAAGRVQPAVERHQVHARRRPSRGVPGHGGPAGPAPGRRHGRGNERGLPAVRLREVPPTGHHEHPRPPRSRAGSLRRPSRDRPSRRRRERGEPRPGSGQHLHGAAAPGRGAGRRRQARGRRACARARATALEWASPSCSSTTRRTRARP